MSVAITSEREVRAGRSQAVEDWPTFERGLGLQLAREHLSGPIVRVLEPASQSSPPVIVPSGHVEVLSDDSSLSVVRPARVELADPEHAAAWSVLPVESPAELAPVMLYGVETVAIQSGGVLRVEGPPAIVVVDRLTIEPGGSLQVHSMLRMLVGTLWRPAEPEARS
jgi:hypothetical protein